jgi:hypothetical protein
MCSTPSRQPLGCMFDSIFAPGASVSFHLHRHPWSVCSTPSQHPRGWRSIPSRLPWGIPFTLSRGVLLPFGPTGLHCSLSLGYVFRPISALPLVLPGIIVPLPLGTPWYVPLVVHGPAEVCCVPLSSGAPGMCVPLPPRTSRGAGNSSPPPAAPGMWFCSTPYIHPLGGSFIHSGEHASLSFGTPGVNVYFTYYPRMFLNVIDSLS